MDYKQYLAQGNERYLPNLSIDLVIIGYEHQTLKCLLLKIAEKWVLPGGYIQHDESVEDATRHILQLRTGLDDAHLQFLSVFGSKDRQFKALFKEFMIEHDLPWDENLWLNNRFVSLVYYSLVHIGTTHPQLGEMDEAYGWFDFDELPPMWMDHASIARNAREQIKRDVTYEPVTYRLLSEEFTMPELHEAHQIILEEKVDRSRFQKKMLAAGIFERLPKLVNSTPGRNPYKYRRIGEASEE